MSTFRSSSTLGAQLFHRLSWGAGLVVVLVLISAFKGELLDFSHLSFAFLADLWRQAFQAPVYLWAGFALVLVAYTHVRFWTTTMFSAERQALNVSDTRYGVLHAATTAATLVFIWGAAALAYQSASRGVVELMSGAIVLALIGLVLVHKGTQDIWLREDEARTGDTDSSEQAVRSMLLVVTAIVVAIGRGHAKTGDDLGGCLIALVLSVAGTLCVFAVFRLSMFVPKVEELPVEPSTSRELVATTE